MITNIFALEKTVKLNSGYDMPVLGLGTWTLTGSVCENAVYSAIKDGICKREEIFLTTKIVPWSSNPKIEDMKTGNL